MLFPPPRRPDPDREPTPPVPSASETPPTPASRGSIRLFRVARTDVFVHWSWFVAAYYLIKDRPVPYSSLAWDVAEYVAGFGLVLLHEFGHVLACRQVGGKADRVVLWPLGGLAFVATPPRPGADLWTTAAGPLVNLVLAPVLILLAMLTAPGLEEGATDLNHFFTALAWFNVVVLVFNLLPVFPLDGGRILQAVLWWWLGRSRALGVAAGIGLVAAAGFGVWALAAGDWWLAVTAGFLVLGSVGGLSEARRLARLSHADRRPDRVCPTCGMAAPVGDFWRCSKCLGRFDLFAAAGCQKGGAHAPEGSCPECGRQVASSEWLTPAAGRSEDG